MIYIIVRTITRTILKLFFCFKVTGLENVPADGGFVLASNHVSHFDPPVLGCAFPKPIYFLAKKELFCGFFSWLLPHLNSIPVNRGASDIRALRRTISELTNGKGLVVFPEGTRSIDGQLQPPEKGAGFLIAKSGVPVVPVYVEGTYKVYPKGAKRLKLSPISVRIGKPLYFDKQGGSEEGKTSDYYMRVSQQIMASIAELKKSFDR